MNPTRRPKRDRPSGGNKLVGEQPTTLLAIRDYLKAEGLLPTAGELGEILDLSANSASMRMGRLKEMGYLVRDDNNDWMLSDDVIDQPETAALLIEFRDSGSRMTRDAFVSLISNDSRFGISTEESDALVDRLTAAQYLNHTMRGWAGVDILELGPQFARERPYLELLAKRVTPRPSKKVRTSRRRTRGPDDASVSAE